MQSLFLAMIPSIAMADEVSDGCVTSGNSTGVLNKFVETIGKIFNVFSLLPDVWGLLIGIALAAVILWIVSYFNRNRPTLDSTFAITLLTATGGFFWWCREQNIVLPIVKTKMDQK